jgi:hypothetical protein
MQSSAEPISPLRARLAMNFVTHKDKFDFRTFHIAVCPIYRGKNGECGRAIGSRWLNSARIVLVMDDSGRISKFGFADGTLPDHLETCHPFRP